MPSSWLGLCVFVVPERWAVPLSEPVAGIARGLEVLEILRLDAPGRTAVARRLGPRRRFPAAAGAPHTLVVACDVPPAPGDSDAERRVAQRIESVARYTTRRMWRDRPPMDDVVRYTVGPEAALDMLNVLNDPALAADLVRSGLQTIRKRHTCAHRVNELLVIYDTIKPAAMEEDLLAPVGS